MCILAESFTSLNSWVAIHVTSGREGNFELQLMDNKQFYLNLLLACINQLHHTKMVCEYIRTLCLI